MVILACSWPDAFGPGWESCAMKDLLQDTEPMYILQPYRSKRAGATWDSDSSKRMASSYCALCMKLLLPPRGLSLAAICDPQSPFRCPGNLRRLFSIARRGAGQWKSSPPPSTLFCNENVSDDHTKATDAYSSRHRHDFQGRATGCDGVGPQ